MIWASEVELAEQIGTSDAALDLVQVSSRSPAPFTPALTSALHARELDWGSSRDRAELIMAALGGAIEQDEASRAATASLMEESSQPVRVGGWFRDLPGDI
jgi:hypothetical protein